MEITNEKAERKYKKELSKGSINTATTPFYNSFNQYKKMLIEIGYKIKD